MSPASFSTATDAADALIAGPTPLNTKSITLLSGQNCVRGTVLGKYATAGTLAASAHAGNTGTGVAGTLSIGTAAKEGVYKIVIVEPASNAGNFIVEDPDGFIVGRGTVAVAFTGPINFTVTDATDFVAGDTLYVTVSAVTYKYLKSLAAATDGSQTPDAILAEDCDASAADKTTVAYVRGDFAASKLTLGTGHTAATIREGLRRLGIAVITIQGA